MHTHVPQPQEQTTIMATLIYGDAWLSVHTHTRRLCGCGLNEVILADGLHEVWWLRQRSLKKNQSERRNGWILWEESLHVHIKSLPWFKSCKNISSKSVAVVKNKTANNNIVVIAQILARTLCLTHNILIGWSKSVFSRLKALNTNHKFTIENVF